MNKPELATMLANTTSMTKTEATRAVDGMITAISTALGRGETVNLHGFGVFSIETRPARQGRNPRTGELIGIPASRAPKFRGCGALRAAVNAAAPAQQEGGSPRSENCDSAQ